MATETEISIGIRKVRIEAFFVNEKRYRLNEDNKLQFTFQHKIDTDVENNLLYFTLRVYFFYPDIGEGEKLLDFHVQNTFYIADFAKYVVKNPLDNEHTVLLTDNVWIIIASLSLTHTRALMSVNIAGTVYNNLILPIVNPEDFARKLLGLNMQVAPPNEDNTRFK
jgi:hypothetical protein